MVPAGALVQLPALVIDPYARWKVDITAPRRLHQRRDEDVGTEEVFVLHEPRGSVFRILEEEPAQHRVSLPAGDRGLGVYVGHEPVPELDRPPEVIGEVLTVFPGLRGRPAVAPAVRAQHAKRQPATVEVFGCCVGETPYKVAPERDPAQAQGEPAPERSGHPARRILVVAAPVQRVTLAAGPGATREGYGVACDVSGRPRHRPVVAQGVQVVLVESPLPRGVHAGEESGLPEVRRKDADA